jgi:hypothetical protein
MIALPKFLLEIFKPDCQHDPGIYVYIEDGELKEPSNVESRKIKIRMGYVKCENCDKIFKILPMGIVLDPVKGVHMKEDEPLERHADLDEEDKKELIKALAAEGIKI